MTLEELNNSIESIETQVAQASKNEDSKILIGLLVRGVWEVARQIAAYTDYAKHGGKNPLQ